MIIAEPRDQEPLCNNQVLLLALEVCDQSHRELKCDHTYISLERISIRDLLRADVLRDREIETDNLPRSAFIVATIGIKLLPRKTNSMPIIESTDHNPPAGPPVHLTGLVRAWVVRAWVVRAWVVMVSFLLLGSQSNI
jgi:hypothetical protein